MLVLDKIKSLLNDLISPSTQVAACTLYVQDPCWPSSLRLVCAPGVDFPEGANGILVPALAPIIGQTELYYSDAKQDPVQRPNSSEINRLLTDPDPKNRIFGNFICRERIHSRAWFLHWEKNRVNAMLSVNYRQTKIHWTAEERELLSKLFANIITLIPALNSYLLRQSAMHFTKLVSIIAPTKTITSADQSAGISILRTEPFIEILRSALQAFDIGDNGFGTIHLLQPDNLTLLRIAHAGNIDESLSREQSLERGQGVVSWVALRKQPVLIGNLSTSKFKSIHVELRTNIRSEVAVPLMDGDRVLGVLNLECEEQDHFPQESIAVLSHAATQVAVAHKLDELERRRNLDKELLRVYSTFPTVLYSDSSLTTGDSSLKSLALAACEYFRIPHCEIWRRAGDHFQSLATTLPPDETSSMAQGSWKQYIFEQKHPVYITRMNGSILYAVQEFDVISRRWSEPRAATDVSSKTPRLPQGIGSKLGVPVFVADLPEEAKCRGVVWFYCSEAELDSVALRVFHSSAEEFVGPASLGLALEYVDNDEEMRSDAFGLLTRTFQHEGTVLLEKLLRGVKKHSQRHSPIFQQWEAFLSYLNAYFANLRWFRPGVRGREASLQMLSRSKIDIRELVGDADIVVSAMMDNEFPRCELCWTSDSVEFINGDYPRLFLLLVNLVLNAKKFTDNDKRLESIFVYFERCRIGEKRGVRIRVDDQTGQPVPPEAREALGKRIGTRGNWYNRKTEGTGFGLYLCRQIALAHNGDMLPIEVHKGKYVHEGNSFQFFISELEIENDD